MIHIVVPEGLNRRVPGIEGLSAHYQECLRQVALRAADQDRVYLAPGNAFGYDRLENELALLRFREMRPALTAYTVTPRAGRYLDTLDNALFLRQWAMECGHWPLPEADLYCARFHSFRSRLCFRAAGFRIRQVITSAPAGLRRGYVTTRLFYYEIWPAHICYEVLATGYALLRIAKRLLIANPTEPSD
jgi:hypothetical protein